MTPDAYFIQLLKQSPDGATYYTFFINTTDRYKTDNKGACSNLATYLVLVFCFLF